MKRRSVVNHPSDPGETPTVNEWRAGRRLSDGASLILLVEDERQLERRCSLSGDMPDDSESNRLFDFTTSASMNTYLTGLIGDLRWCFQELGASADKVTNKRIEALAVFVHSRQSSNSRGFHNVGRLFEISAGATPIQCVAAIFRDVVCYFTDEPLGSQEQAWIQELYDAEDSRILATPSPEDRLIRIVLTLFGYHPGQNLGMDGNVHDVSEAIRLGHDKLLSVVVMVRLLQDTLSEKHLTQIAACIEATIPFRETIAGETPIDLLYKRLIALNGEFDLGMTDQELILTVQQGMDLKNRVLGSFITKDIGVFLSHTWSVLPEHYPSLRRQYLYTLSEFHFALRDMTKVLKARQSKDMFGSFQGVPDDEEVEAFNDQLRHNLKACLPYMYAQELSLAVVSAFATLTGGDAPVSFFYGDLPNGRDRSDRLDDFLPVLRDPSDACNMDVYRILLEGRQRTAQFDTRNKRSAAYLYGILGDAKVEEALSKTSWPMTEESSFNLLRYLPREPVVQIGHAAGKIAVSRTEEIDRVLRELRKRELEQGE